MIRSAKAAMICTYRYDWPFCQRHAEMKQLQSICDMNRRLHSCERVRYKVCAFFERANLECDIDDRSPNRGKVVSPFGHKLSAIGCI